MTTWSTTDKSATVTLSNGNLTATSSTAVSQSVRSSTSQASGKKYLEFTMTTLTNDWTVGVANATEGLVFGGGSGLGADGNGAGFYPVSPAQQTYYNGVPVGAGGGSASVNGAIISVAVDFTNHLIWVSTAVMRAASQPWNNSATDNPSTATGGNSFVGLTGPYFAMFDDDIGGAVCVANFGATAFNQTIPTGFAQWDPAGSVGTATGTATVTAVGNSAAATVGTATGSSTASATGNSAAASVGTATGSSTATAVGNSLAKSVGSATGSGTDTAVGNSAALSVGSATGTGTASGVSNSAAVAVGSASGSGTDTGVANSAAATVGTATGTGAASGVGNSAAASIGSATGTGTAAGVALGGSIGSASGTGTAAATGNSAAAAIGSSSGTGTVSGASSGSTAAAPGGPGDGAARRRRELKIRELRTRKKRASAARQAGPAQPEAEYVEVMQGRSTVPGLTRFQDAIVAQQADLDDEDDVATLLAMAV